jgi:hypothetical protein
MPTPVELASARHICNSILHSLVGSTLAPQWWHQPNKHWDFRTPDLVWQTNPQSVINYLLGQLNADYS